jgi:hypothetical protein
MPAPRFALMLAALAVAGCTASGIGALSPLPPNPPDIVVVTKAAVEIFTKLKLPGSAEISRLRPAHPSSLADWMFCMRSSADDIPRTYALFVRDSKISNYRLAVQIDECARETFESVGERAP